MLDFSANAMPIQAPPKLLHPAATRLGLRVGFGATKPPALEDNVAITAKPTSGKTDDTPKKSHDSFIKITAKEAVKNGAVIGLTLLLAPLLGPALVGAVGGAGLMSGVMFGVVVPAALEYGLNRYEGRMDQFKVWVQRKIHTPAKAILTPLAHSPFGRLLDKNPKQWLTTTLDKLNPENLLARLKQQQATEKAAGAAGKVAAKNPLSPQRFMKLFRQHLKHLGWGPAMLVSLHGVLAGVRQFFSIGHQLKGSKAAFSKGIRSGLMHTGKQLFARGGLKGGLKGLRLGLFLRQALIANTVVWGAMKGVNLFSRLAYGKSISAMVAHAKEKAATAANTAVKKAVA